MAGNAAAFLGAGLMAGVGKSVMDNYLEEARSVREAKLREMDQKFRSAEADKDREFRTQERQAGEKFTEGQNKATREHNTGLLSNTRKVVDDKDRVWQEGAGGKATPVLDANGNQITERSPYAARRGAMVKVGGDSGKIYASDHEGPGDDGEAVVSVSATDALRLKSVQANNDTKLKLGQLTGDTQRAVATSRADATVAAADRRGTATENAAETRAGATRDAAQTRAGATRDAATTAADSRRDVADRNAASRGDVADTNARSREEVARIRAENRAIAQRPYAPDLITKYRDARDKLPEDHPDRAYYEEAMRLASGGKGSLTEAKVAEIKQRTLKDVQTATDARGKSLFATQEAQQTEYERRLNIVLPQKPAPRPAPAAGSPAPAAAPARQEPAPGAPPEAQPPASAAAGKPKGAGTRADPFQAAAQADVDWFRQHAPAGSVIIVNGKAYTK